MNFSRFIPKGFLPLLAFALGYSAFVVAAPAPASAKTFKTDWVEPGYALCEGIGIHGTYRAYLEATGRVGADGITAVSHVTGWISSAAVSMGSPSLGIRLEVRRGATVVKSALLARPTGPAVERAPAPNETSRLYLRGADAPLHIPAGCKLVVIVSPVINRPEGSCALSISRKKVVITYP